jgi:hypothetical protein
MDLGEGGGVGICTYMPQYIVFSLFLSKKVEKGSQTKTKVGGRKHTMAFIQKKFHLVFSN